LGERAHLATPAIELASHSQDVVNVLVFEDLSQVVLVGHSYGGMVITEVAKPRIGLRQAADRIAPSRGSDCAKPRIGLRTRCTSTP
jgi:hypothetical protein